MICLGFASGCRRSELVALDVGDISFGDDGLEITIRRSKTDQEGLGRKVGIPYGGRPRTCPVRAVRDWLEHRWTDPHAVAVVSWDPRTAVAVPWGLFARRWDDFCYPSSDDVTIAIATGEWILEYAHYEQMRWLPRPSTARPN